MQQNHLVTDPDLNWSEVVYITLKKKSHLG